MSLTSSPAFDVSVCVSVEESEPVVDGATTTVSSTVPAISDSSAKAVPACAKISADTVTIVKIFDFFIYLLLKFNIGFLLEYHANLQFPTVLCLSHNFLQVKDFPHHLSLNQR